MQISLEEEGVITLLGALGEDGGPMHGMQENEVQQCITLQCTLYRPRFVWGEAQID